MKRLAVLFMIALIVTVAISVEAEPLAFISHVMHLPMVMKGHPPKILFGAGATYGDSHEAMENLGRAGRWTQQWRRFPEDYPGSEDVPKLQKDKDVCGPHWWEPGDECMCQSVGGDSSYILNVNEPTEGGWAAKSEEEMAVLLYHSFQCHPYRRHIGMGTGDLEYQRRVFTMYEARYGPLPLVGLAIHCYGGLGGDDCIVMMGQAAELAEDFGLSQVWISEIAYIGPMSPTLAFMEQTMQHAAGLAARYPGIETVRYGWFQARFKCVGWPEEKWWNWPYCTSLAEWESQELAALGLRYRELALHMSY